MRLRDRLREARDPSIDPERIAFLRFSFGGEVAHDTAFERLRAKLGECRPRFASLSPIPRPGCTGWSPLQNAYTGAPILMMVGGNDTLPVAKAESYLSYAQASGHPAL